MIVKRYIDIQDKRELKRLRYIGLTKEDLERLSEQGVILVVIYARYSSDMQREESIDAQIRYCKEEIERNPNMLLVGVYYDEAMTGKFDNREDFQNMIADARELKFAQVMVHKFSRFARNQYDSVIYKKTLRDIGIKVTSATQRIDDTPEGQMTEAIIEALDQYYSANLSEEVLKGMRENALKGLSTGGRPPLGYRYDDSGRLQINPDTAPIARRIFEMYVGGYGTLSIANTLNAEGYRSQTGKEFRSRTITDILANEKYIGTYFYTIGNEQIKIENNHEALISADMWRTVKEVKKERTKPRISSGIIYSLTGKMFCGECTGMYSGGGSKVSNGSKGKYRNYYYICNNKRNHNCSNRSVNKEKLEYYLCDHILKELLTDESIAEIATQFEETVNEMMRASNTIPLETLKAEKASLEKKIAKLLDLYLDDDSTLSKEEYKAKSDGHKKHLRAIEKQIAAAETDYSKLLKKEDALNYLRQFRTSFDYSSKMIVKSLLDTFIDKIIVHHDRLEVTYKVDFPNSDELNDALVGGNVRNGRTSLTLPPLLFQESVSRTTLGRITNHILFS